MMEAKSAGYRPFPNSFDEIPLFFVPQTLLKRNSTVAFSPCFLTWLHRSFPSNDSVEEKKKRLDLLKIWNTPLYRFDSAATIDLTASFSFSERARYWFNNSISSFETWTTLSPSSKNSDKEMPKASQIFSSVSSVGQVPLANMLDRVD